MNRLFDITWTSSVGRIKERYWS